MFSSSSVQLRLQPSIDDVSRGIESHHDKKRAEGEPYVSSDLSRSPIVVDEVDNEGGIGV